MTEPTERDYAVGRKISADENQAAMIAGALAGARAEERERTCVWTSDSDGGWDASCGCSFIINDGSPADNDMRFCCYCGGKLTAKIRSGE